MTRTRGAVRLAIGAALSALLGATPSRAAETANERAELRRWSSASAFTLPRGRLEFGLFQPSHYGLTDRLELSLHLIVFFVLPHVELKHRFFETQKLAAAVRYRLSYPTAFLNFVSREGSGGLLPATSDPPFALQIEGDAVFSALWQRRQLATLSLGLAVAPHASFAPEELPLLDFPFLYPRFAPVYSVFVPRAGASFEGPLVASLHYRVDLRAYLMPDLPDVGTAAALEQAAALEYRFGERVGLEVGLLVSEAEYAIGYRVHFLPYFDVRVGF